MSTIGSALGQTRYDASKSVKIVSGGIELACCNQSISMVSLTLALQVVSPAAPLSRLYIQWLLCWGLSCVQNYIAKKE
eukprot:5539846-Pleurochrysis_carterae.AAC.1